MKKVPNSVRSKLAKSGTSKKVRAAVPHVAKRFRKPTLQEQTEKALSNVPRITNETVAEHREEVLRGARKYKYPLEHSKHKIVVVSSVLLATGLIGFFVYIGLSLYKFQSTSLFTYRVTQVLPFPVARAADRWVSYESYLFELRRYMHYYESQQLVDFDSESGKFQLDTYRPKALEQVVNAAFVKELAEKNRVEVSEREVDDAIAALRAQNQLGNDNEELASVAQRFFGWSIEDLRRQLRQELLAQKVAAKLDTTAQDEARQILGQIRSGADFAAMASQASDDEATKANGGEYADTAITTGTRGVPVVVIRTLGTMQPGQVSEVVTTPTAFEIVKLISNDNGKYKAAHIQVQFRGIQEYLDPLEKSNPPKKFISVQSPEQ